MCSMRSFLIDREESSIQSWIDSHIAQGNCKIYGEWVRMECPVCHHNPPTLSYNPTTKFYQCFFAGCITGYINTQTPYSVFCQIKKEMVEINNRRKDFLLNRIFKPKSIPNEWKEILEKRIPEEFFEQIKENLYFIETDYIKLKKRGLPLSLVIHTKSIMGEDCYQIYNPESQPKYNFIQSTQYPTTFPEIFKFHDGKFLFLTEGIFDALYFSFTDNHNKKYISAASCNGVNNIMKFNLNSFPDLVTIFAPDNDVQKMIFNKLFDVVQNTERQFGVIFPDKNFKDWGEMVEGKVKKKSLDVFLIRSKTDIIFLKENLR